jgi:hypothetical protein
MATIALLIWAVMDREAERTQENPLPMIPLKIALPEH